MLSPLQRVLHQLVALLQRNGLRCGRQRNGGAGGPLGVGASEMVVYRWWVSLLCHRHGRHRHVGGHFVETNSTPTLL